MEGVYSIIEWVSQQGVWLFETIQANIRIAKKLAMEFYKERN
jgi:hypothetical protein